MVGVKSEITAKNYEGFLRRLREGLNIKDTGIEFLKDYTKVCAWIDDLKLKTGEPISDNSKKAYYVSVKTALRDAKIYPEAQAVYDSKFKTLAEKVYNKTKTQTLTKTESEKYLSWDQILALKDKIEPKEDTTDWHTIQDWVIYCLYTMIAPLRADYSPMKFYDRKPREDKGNYLVLRKKKPYFVLHDYKTSAKFGRVERLIPKSLVAVLTVWRTFNPSEWLLLKSKGGEPMASDTLSQRVIRLFERVSNKPAGISMLRHAYITKMRGGKELSYDQKEALSREMLHSMNTNEMYRRIDAE